MSDSAVVRVSSTPPATEKTLEESQAEPALSNGRYSLCQNCQKIESRYKCPGCGVQTCSLPCSKAHREISGCTGKRSRSTFRKVSDFDEQQLLADIRFMEDIEREFGSARRREPLKQPAILPRLLQELRQEAGRRQVDLEVLGPGMQKRNQNTTYHDRRHGRLLWHVEWIFVRAKLHIHDRRVPEGNLLSDQLQKHIEPQCRGFKDDEKMLPYTQAAVKGLTVVMRQARAPVNKVRYHEMDLSLSLAQNLQGKRVIEYPILLVLLSTEVKEYPLMDTQLAAGPKADSSGSEESTDEGSDKAS